MLISATSSQPSPAPPPPGCQLLDGEQRPVQARHVVTLPAPAEGRPTHPQFEVADIFRSHGEEYLEKHPERYHDQRRLMKSIMACRTAELGGHIYVCTACGVEDQSYNSCRHRLCPKCERSKRLKWAEARIRELLPVDYQFLTVVPPKCLAWIILRNPRKVVGLLFQSAACSLQETAADPKYLGAKVGLLAVYQSWGEQVQHHPHIHVCTPAGGISLDGLRWVYGKSAAMQKS